MRSETAMVDFLSVAICLLESRVSIIDVPVPAALVRRQRGRSIE
jgi:sorbitol-specific phosphotransferase system component IIBC